MTNAASSPQTQPTAVFMMGGPGAGKSYIRKREFPTLPVVDCDQFKEAHHDYDPQNPAALHAWSSQQCTKSFFRHLGGDESFVYDGTGTNAEKMVDWMLKASSAGFRVQLVYVTCPLQTALKRNRERSRFVPEHIVREKHQVVDTSFQLSKGYADSVIVFNNS